MSNTEVGKGKRLPFPTARAPQILGSWPWQRLAVVLTALIGVGILLYPTAAAWFTDHAHATEIKGYARTVEGISPTDQETFLAQARQYNADLPAGPLRDPYSLNTEGVPAAGNDYPKILDVGPGGMMGRISIPSIHAELPIFHGTDESTLSRGVGHLCGSSFPVGGSSTHSVLTAHSGFVNATLFDNLDKVAVGDTFQVSVLNETLNYRVDQILTVLPQETDSLRRVNGKDYITLVTCTPRGINSHRLLVRGERVDSPPGPTGNEAHGGPFTEPGFPWWMLILAGTLAGSVLLTRPRPSHVSTEDCPTASATSQPTE